MGTHPVALPHRTQLSARPRITPRPAETRRDRRGPMTRTPTPPPEPPIGTQEGLEGRRCYTCGRVGHLARSCPGGRDVSMLSAYADEGRRRPCMLATCWAQGAVGSPTIPARVMNRDTQALLDTGSVVTLLRPRLGGREGGGTNGGRLRAWGHPDLWDLPRGRSDPLRGVRGPGQELSPIFRSHS